MGLKLAGEMIDFIAEWLPHNSLSRKSFVRHSLGLIVRAALPHLDEFQSKMHMYMSLSSPHLGVTKGSSNLVRPAFG